METVHDYRDVLFGGHAPEPRTNCWATRKAKMREMGAELGMATDGDADRFGIVDGDGTFIQPNYVIALLFDYLVRRGLEERRGQERGDDEFDQCAGGLSQGSSVRDAGGV